MPLFLESLLMIFSGLLKLGFYRSVEAALGADLTALNEAKELVEKGFLTSSCCPAFVNYIRSYVPGLKNDISHNLSPMAQISSVLKDQDPDCFASNPPRRYPDSGGPGKSLPQNRQAGVPPGGFMD